MLSEIMYYDGPVLFVAQDLDKDLTESIVFAEYIDDDGEDRIFTLYPLPPRVEDGKVISNQVNESQIEWVHDVS